MSHLCQIGTHRELDGENDGRAESLSFSWPAESAHGWLITTIRDERQTFAEATLRRGRCLSEDLTILGRADFAGALLLSVVLDVGLIEREDRRECVADGRFSAGTLRCLLLAVKAIIVWKCMSGRRALTTVEERQLLSVVRQLNPRDRAVITTQWFTGFRIHEVLALTVEHVLRNGEIVEQIGLTPRHLKGGCGGTRWVPVLPELHRALRKQLWWLKRNFGLTPALPLFPSRKRAGSDVPKALSRCQAHDIVKAAFRAAGIVDDGRLGTHTLRKTFAKNVYKNSGNDIMVLKAALHHSDVGTTQKYLEIDEERVTAAIRACDFTGNRRRERLPPGRMRARWPRGHAALRHAYRSVGTFDR